MSAPLLSRRRVITGFTVTLIVSWAVEASAQKTAPPTKGESRRVELSIVSPNPDGVTDVVGPLLVSGFVSDLHDKGTAPPTSASKKRRLTTSLVVWTYDPMEEKPGRIVYRGMLGGTLETSPGVTGNGQLSGRAVLPPGDYMYMIHVCDPDLKSGFKLPLPPELASDAPEVRGKILSSRGGRVRIVAPPAGR